MEYAEGKVLGDWEGITESKFFNSHMGQDCLAVCPLSLPLSAFLLGHRTVGCAICQML